MSTSNLVKQGAWPATVMGVSQGTVTLTTGMTNLATAYKLAADSAVVGTSGASGNAIALPAGASQNDVVYLGNNTANALSVLPATAAGKINALGAGAAFAQTANKHALYFCLGGDNWASILSA